MCATGTSPKLHPELFENIDWDRFLAGAESHGVAAVVAQRILESELRSRLDAGVERRLRQVYQTTLMRSFPLAQEIHSITRAFKNENVPIIPYKGPALAERYWGSFAVRDCVDLDFLVRPRDVERAGTILEALGYERVARIPHHLRPALIRNASEEQFRHRETGLLLELQWAPSPQVFALKFDTSEMWSKVSNIAFAGEEVLSPSPEDLLLLLCIHGWKHNWSRLIWVGDVVRLLDGESINWARLMARAKREGTLGVLSLGLLIAHTLFDVPLPPSLIIENRIKQLSEVLITRMQSAQCCSYVEWHRFMLAARDSNTDRLRQMTSFLFTPGLGEYAACDLPASTAAGYKLIRLARVMRLFPGKAIESV